MATLPDGFEAVALTPDRLPDVVELDMWAFPTSDSLESLVELPNPLSWDRARGIERADRPGELVAMHASYPFGNTPVPGGRMKVAGLTWVGVHPQWRRRGLLRSMMETHFQDCLDRGEPVSLDELAG